MKYNIGDKKDRYSELCQILFDSIAEKKRGEELYFLQQAGEISELEYQSRIDLCDIKQYKCFIKIDFKYRIDGKIVYEDVKGMRYTRKKRKQVALVDREFRTKLAWLKDKYGIEVILTKDQ